MKRIYRITIITALCVILFFFGIWLLFFKQQEWRQIKVGIIYNGDAATAYTYNFIKAMSSVSQTYGEQVEIIHKYNIHEGKEEEALQELVAEGCSLVFSTSYGFEETTKEFAGKYPEIQFCQAAGDNANREPVLDNYHNFMGEIYQGRYICGVVAGMKLQELEDKGAIDAGQAKVGYVAAYPYAEVISGYTAFLLGVRSVVPEAEMEVIYTNTWGNFSLEKEAAEKLIDDGCIVISQHSDTRGAAVACENANHTSEVYHVGYNQNMSDIAPTASLTGCRINWEPYVLAAVEAVMEGKKIESVVEGRVHGAGNRERDGSGRGNDVSAGFDKGWVEMLQINEVVAALGTSERVEELVRQFQKGDLQVFRGDYIGVDPFDETDVYDLQQGFTENGNTSAPEFHYILQDVITFVE